MNRPVRNSHNICCSISTSSLWKPKVVIMVQFFTNKIWPSTRKSIFWTLGKPMNTMCRLGHFGWLWWLTMVSLRTFLSSASRSSGSSCYFSAAFCPCYSSQSRSEAHTESSHRTCSLYAHYYFKISVCPLSLWVWMSLGSVFGSRNPSCILAGGVWWIQFRCSKF